MSRTRHRIKTRQPLAAINLTPAVLAESDSIGTAVGTATATGGARPVTWSLTTSDSGNFAINSSTGAVTTAHALTDLAGARSIVIQVTDGVNTISQGFVIDVVATPSVSPSAFTGLGTLSIAEDATAGTVIASGAVVDADSETVAVTVTNNTKIEAVMTGGKTFQLRLTALGEGDIASGVGEDITLEADDGESTPFTDDFTVTITAAPSGSETLITVLSLKNTAASTKTNEFVFVGLPLASDAITAAQYFSWKDDDGAGNEGTILANYQTVALASDNTPARRWTGMAGIIPSFTSTQNRKTHIKSSNSNVEPSGTAITAADILALAGAANGLATFECTISATNYAADAETVLGGSSTWSKTAAVLQTWASGPCMSYFIGSMPLMNGATPHASGLGVRIFFHIIAWKAGTAAVSGGNPIKGLEIWVKIENGSNERASPANYTMTNTKIGRATSLSDATIIYTSDTDADGNTITYDYSSASESCAYMSAPRRPLWIGQKPTIIHCYGSVSNAADPGDTTHRDYMRSTKMIPYYKSTYASVSHTNGITKLNTTGTTKLWQTGLGEFVAAWGQGGETAGIGPFPAWDVEGITKWDSSGRRRIYENQQILSTTPDMSCRLYDAATTAGQAGVYERYDNTIAAGDRTLDSRFLPTLIAYPGTSVSPFTNTHQETAFAHLPNHGAMAYMLTGRVVYLETLNAKGSQTHMIAASAYAGSHTNYTHFGPLNSTALVGPNGCISSGAIQYRDMAWTMVLLSQLTVLSPDTDRANIVIPKSVWQQYIANNFTKAANFIAANTGAGQRWLDSGVHWTHANSGTYDFGSDGQVAHGNGQGYTCIALGLAKNLLSTDANLDALLAWLAGYYRAIEASTTISPDYLMGCQFFPISSTTVTGNVPLRTAEEIYAEFTKMNPKTIVSGRTRRPGVGTLTLSATSGTDVTCTFESALLSTTNAEVGAWICEVAAGGSAGPGVGRIKSVAGDGMSCVIDTTVTGAGNSGGFAFTATSFAASRWALPPPVASVVVEKGTRSYTGGQTYVASDNYIDVSKAACASLLNAGVSDVQACFTYLDTWKPTFTTTYGPKWDIGVAP